MTPRMIVVTGGAGFIGSNIVARLTAETAYDVVVCDRLETADLAKWKNLAKHSIADFWAPEELFEQLERHAERIEAVVHMGAISSTTEPDADLILRTNFTLSRDLWDWCAIRDARIAHQSHRSRDRVKLVRRIRSASGSVVDEMAPMCTTASIRSA